ncbi:MAG: hypothetical protein U0798_03575 [Gemmataceae bacterium]
MATVRTACPACGNSLKFPASWAGKSMKCKKCDAIVLAKVNEPDPTSATIAQPALRNQTKPEKPSPVTAAPVSRPAAKVAQPAKPAVPIETHKAKAVPIKQPIFEPSGTADSVSMALDAPTLTYHGSTDANPALISVERYKRPVGNSSGKLGALIAVAVVVLTVGVSTYIYTKRQNELSEIVPATSTTPTNASATPATKNNNLLVAAKFPRRLLFVNISRYAFMNPLTPGQGARGDAATDSARKLAFEWRVPMDRDNNQFYSLCDTGGKKDAVAIMKVVLQGTFDRFIESSRAQDHIAIYFGGHVIEKEGKAYLVPSDGDPDELTTLIPLSAFYEKLAACPAQQKIVMWDVCRYNPQFGRVLPGSDPMDEKLFNLLSKPPAGIQALVTCSIGENAIELPRSGSEFLASFRTVAEKTNGPKSGSSPDDAIPFADWIAAIQTKLNQYVVKDGKPNQKMSLTGSPGAPVEFNPDEAVAKRFAFPPPPKGADPEAVAAAFDSIDLPSMRRDRAGAGKPGQSFTVPADALKDYTSDTMTLEEAVKQKEKYPIRAAAANAILKIRSVWKGAGGKDGGLRETFVGEANDRVKKAILAEQETPARIILELDSIIEECEKLEKDLEKEPSKRWRATFQYAYAQAKARWVYMNEYNLMLGVINKNELPPLDEKKGDSGWQLISKDQMKSKKDIREKAEQAQELFNKIATEHKGTPWAVMAKVYKNVKLGLDWRVVTAKEDKEE